ACAIGMSSKYLGEELRRFSGSSRLGPVGALVFAEVLRLARLPAQTQAFARAGLGQLSLEGLGREKDWALAPGCLPRKILEMIGEAASHVPAADLDAIVAEAERSGAEADKAFAERIRAARSSNDPSLRGWLLVEAFWSAGLAGAVQDRLKVLAEGE
ncbi:MAG TPA: hypothetical protein VMT52_02535, partial [Planctomycetota bacterium]|nr:hypothetical protein [Planctomycetota bacterium]